MRRSAALLVLALFAAPCLCQAGSLAGMVLTWAGHGKASHAVPPCHATAAKLPDRAADSAWQADGCCCPGDHHGRAAILASADAAPRTSFPALWADSGAVRPADSRRDLFAAAGHDPPAPPVTSIRVLRT